MKPASVRQKGKKFERKVASMFRSKGLGRAGRTLGSGSGWRKGDVDTDLPLHIECKNHERISIWKFWDQTTEQKPRGHDPVLFITSNHRPILAVVEADYLLNLLKTEQDYLSDV